MDTSFLIQVLLKRTRKWTWGLAVRLVTFEYSILNNLGIDKATILIRARRDYIPCGKGVQLIFFQSVGTINNRLGRFFIFEYIVNVPIAILEYC